MLSELFPDYASRVQRLSPLATQLRAAGSQADLTIPRVVVTGDEGARESGLVEAISGIRNPLSKPCCPVELCLMHCTGSWEASLSIRWEAMDRKSKTKKGKKQNSYGSSQLPEARKITYHETVTHFEDLELALRRAQAAACTDVDLAPTFLTKSEDELDSTGKFSMNTVCVHIKGPQLIDLEVVDLSGLTVGISSDPCCNVERLAVSHIKRGSLILVVLPDNTTSIEDHYALRLARQTDLSGSCTIGILAKRDVLPSSETDSSTFWLDILEGRQHPTELGYHCIRQLTEEEREEGVTLGEVKEQERAYFSNTTPWASTSHPDRFGTMKLTARLDVLLAGIVDRSILAFDKAATQKLTILSTRLSGLQPILISPSNPAAHVLNVVARLVVDCQMLIHSVTDATLSQRKQMAYENFQHAIKATAPWFVPTPSEAEGGLLVSTMDVDIADEGWEGAKTMPTPMYLEDVRRRIQTCSNGGGLAHSIPHHAKILLVQAFQAQWNSLAQSCFDGVNDALLQSMADLVKLRVGNFTTLQSTLMHLIQDLLKSKGEDTTRQIAFLLKCERSPYTQQGYDLSLLEQQYLTRYKGVRARVVKERQFTSESTAKASVNPTAPISSFGILGSKPSTNFFATSNVSANTPGNASTGTFGGSGTPSSSGFFGSASSTAGTTQPFSKVQGSGFNKPANSTLDRATEKQVLDGLAQMGIKDVSLEDIAAKLSPPDKYENEMELMAEVRAYFQISYKRITDNVPMVIEHMFVHPFAESLQGVLIKEMGLGTKDSDARCREYLVEDPVVVRERQDLTEKVKVLEDVKAEMQRMGVPPQDHVNM